MLDLEAQVDLYFKWENALNEPEPDVALIASLESEAASHDLDLWELNNFLLNAYTAAVRYGATDWNPVLHPRGMDGKFIEVLGRVLLTRFTDKRGRDRDNEIGHVVSIKPAGDWKRSKPNSVDIEVELANGERVLVKPYAVKSAPVPKADVAATVDVWGEDEEVLGWLPEKPSEPKQRKIGGFVNRLATYLMEMDETALDRWFAKFMGTAIPKKDESIFASALLAADWNPDLHPRDRDGRFIEVFGLVHLFDYINKDGDRIAESKGKVVDIRPTDRPGYPDVEVELFDGSHIITKPNMVETMDSVKARLARPDPREAQAFEESLSSGVPPELRDQYLAYADATGSDRLDLWDWLDQGKPSGTESEAYQHGERYAESEGLGEAIEVGERYAESEGLSDTSVEIDEVRETIQRDLDGTEPINQDTILKDIDSLDQEDARQLLQEVIDANEGHDRLDVLEDALFAIEPEAPGDGYDTDREVGNLMVGDEVILPGDIPGEVIDFEFPEDAPDSIVIVTDNGTYFGKTTDILPSKRRQ